VDGAGRRALLGATCNDAPVSALLHTAAAGSTTASFATQQTFAAGSVPYSVAVADVNGDGRPDLLVANDDDANYFSGTVSVLLNTTAAGAATPSFATQQTFATGSNPKSVAVGDVNSDGRPDLLPANHLSRTAGEPLN